jgi:EmrB/QacA subfamily drug resistance transporter
MIIVDSQIVILALPSIEADLGLGLRSSQWVMSVYLLTFGGLLLLGGRTADLLGGRRMFLIGTALFGVASLACGLAWSSGVLIGARAVQGAAAAIMAPTAMAVLMATFPPGKERNRAVGIWTGVGAFGATAALLIGGPITEGLGWPWIFLINLPLAAIVLVLGPRLLRETPVEPGRRSFDPLGAVTITAALGLLVYGIVEAPEAGWTSPRTLLVLGGAVALLLLFVLVERRSRAPLVPLRIFRSAAFVGGNLMTLLVAMAIYGGALMMSVYAQQVLGYSAVRFGLSTAIYAAMSVVGSNLAGPLTTRFGYPRVAVGGAIVLATGAFLLSRVSADGSYWTDLFPGLVVFGFGIGTTVVSAAIAALSSAAPTESGLASGINNSLFQVGAGLGIALCTSVSVAVGASGLIGGVRGAFVATFVFAVACLVVAAVSAARRRA